MHQRDQEVQNLCDEKMKLILELLEVFAKDEVTVVCINFGGTQIYTKNIQRVNIHESCMT